MVLPPVKPSDPEDVSWALSTAHTSNARGDAHDALKWLRRAAEAAAEADQDDRALELAKAVADLAVRVGASQPPPPPSRPMPPISARPSAPPPSARPTAPPQRVSVPPSARPSAPPSARPTHIPAPRISDAPPSVPRPASKASPKPASVPPKKRRRSIPESTETDTERLTRPSNMDELEAMPTESMSKLPQFEELRVGAVTTERVKLPLVAGARLHLVRAQNGEVKATITPTAGSVAVIVVPLDGGDLAKLFS